MLQTSGDGYYIYNSFREPYGISRRCSPGRNARAASPRVFPLLVLIALCGACSKSETVKSETATENPATEKATATPATDHLSIGKEAPEIEGDDIDGESFKLSDYRGKVVLLDFWGHW
jgi:hypothetical protein